mmetsp:Transcript_2882/g.7323  ORF Transcript_2882/g.7323 Transcript_2882/m.7323 type:complete len:202 (-) Transcript_2882:239-844(-)
MRLPHDLPPVQRLLLRLPSPLPFYPNLSQHELEFVRHGHGGVDLPHEVGIEEDVPFEGRLAVAWRRHGRVRRHGIHPPVGGVGGGVVLRYILRQRLPPSPRPPGVIVGIARISVTELGIYSVTTPPKVAIASDGYDRFRIAGNHGMPIVVVVVVVAIVSVVAVGGVVSNHVIVAAPVRTGRTSVHGHRPETTMTTTVRPRS